MTVIPFERPKSKPERRHLYSIDIFDTDAGDMTMSVEADSPVDPGHLADTMLKMTKASFEERYDNKVIILLHAEFAESIWTNEDVATAAQHDWLARRLDEVYEQVTGRRRSRIPFGAFFHDLFHRLKGDPK